MGLINEQMPSIRRLLGHGTVWLSKIGQQTELLSTHRLWLSAQGISSVQVRRCSWGDLCYRLHGPSIYSCGERYSHIENFILYVTSNEVIAPSNKNLSSKSVAMIFRVSKERFLQQRPRLQLWKRPERPVDASTCGFTNTVERRQQPLSVGTAKFITRSVLDSVKNETNYWY